MSESTARRIVNTVRQVGRAKGDVFEAMMVHGLVARGISEDRARSAARQCSNQIWRNGMVSGAAAVVLVSASSANVAGATAGGAVAALGAGYTMLLSDSCRGVRELSGSDVLNAVHDLMAGK
jgi:hypothetical protein